MKPQEAKILAKYLRLNLRSPKVKAQLIIDLKRTAKRMRLKGTEKSIWITAMQITAMRFETTKRKRSGPKTIIPKQKPSQIRRKRK